MIDPFHSGHAFRTVGSNRLFERLHERGFIQMGALSDGQDVDVETVDQKNLRNHSAGHRQAI